MSKNNAKKLEEQIKPILEKLTFGVLKNKPDNIVSNTNNFFISQNSWLNTYKN